MSENGLLSFLFRFRNGLSVPLSHLAIPVTSPGRGTSHEKGAVDCPPQTSARIRRVLPACTARVRPCFPFNCFVLIFYLLLHGEHLWGFVDSMRRMKTGSAGREAWREVCRWLVYRYIHLRRKRCLTTLQTGVNWHRSRPWLGRNRASVGKEVRPFSAAGIPPPLSCRLSWPWETDLQPFGM